MLEKEGTVEFIDAKKEKKERKKPSRVNLRNFLDGSLMTRELVMKHFNFILLIAFLAMVLIANRLYAEKIIREANKVQQEIKELRSEQITVSSELMEKSRQSSVSELIREKGLGLKELNDPAKKIVLDKDFR